MDDQESIDKITALSEVLTLATARSGLTPSEMVAALSNSLVNIVASTALDRDNAVTCVASLSKSMRKHVGDRYDMAQAVLK